MNDQILKKELELMFERGFLGNTISDIIKWHKEKIQQTRSEALR